MSFAACWVENVCITLHDVSHTSTRFKRDLHHDEQQRSGVDQSQEVIRRILRSCLVHKEEYALDRDGVAYRLIPPVRLDMGGRGAFWELKGFEAA